ncbi:hypothetical protein ACFXHK_39490 [Embleya sp. NPDC059267]|uniref:hypothetical protein n=1 Tax=unclassified Embleya TaxID=2699296 RepID=UPI0036B93EC5
MRGTPGPAPPAGAGPVATAAFAATAGFVDATVPGAEPPEDVRLFGPGVPGREVAEPGLVGRPGVVDVVDDM